MLELSMSLPIKVQNGGLFISRVLVAIRRDGFFPGSSFCRKGILTIREENQIFRVNAGESLLLWPQRSHVGIDPFPADLKFYWLHFEVMPDEGDLTPKAPLSIPQHSRVSEPQYIISLFRQFLREQENIHRSTALELILLLILQQISATASEQTTDSPGMRWRGKRSKSFIPGFIYRFPLQP